MMENGNLILQFQIASSKMTNGMFKIIYMKSVGLYFWYCSVKMFDFFFFFSFRYITSHHDIYNSVSVYTILITALRWVLRLY
jgi:hypothetical protein